MTLGFRQIYDLGFRFRVQGSGFRVSSLGLEPPKASRGISLWGSRGRRISSEFLRLSVLRTAIVQAFEAPTWELPWPL